MDTKHKNVLYREHVRQYSEKILANYLEILKIYEEGREEDIQKWQEFDTALRANKDDIEARARFWAQATGWFRSAADEWYQHLRHHLFNEIEKNKKINRLLIENKELKKEFERLKAQPYN